MRLRAALCIVPGSVVFRGHDMNQARFKSGWYRLMPAVAVVAFYRGFDKPWDAAMKKISEAATATPGEPLQLQLGNDVFEVAALNGLVVAGAMLFLWALIGFGLAGFFVKD